MTAIPPFHHAPGRSPPFRGLAVPINFLFSRLIALIVYAAVRSICQAAVKPLWLDEIFTAIIVRQHGISGMWDALRHSADGQPLLFYLLEWPATAVLRNEQIAYRLLSIVGFLITTACLFALVRKRNGSGVALLSASIPMLSILYSAYSVEARPYAIVIACISMALVCYQRARKFAGCFSWVCVSLWRDRCIFMPCSHSLLLVLPNLFSP